MPAKCLADVDAVILAGGQGTRLRSVWADRPKVLAPINGTPFLRHYIDWLSLFGVRRVILLLGYKADAVTDFVRAETWPRGLEIESCVEVMPLGTGGAVRGSLPVIASDTVLVTNGDSFTDVDLCRFVDFHRRKAARISLLLTHRPEVGASGLVATDSNDAVTSFREKPAGHMAGGYISAGIYLMQRGVIAEIEADKPLSIERDVFPRFCRQGCYGFKGEFPFIDIGTPESYRHAAEFVATRIS